MFERGGSFGDLEGTYWEEVMHIINWQDNNLIYSFW
jgi:hypothetical protein